MDNQTLGALVTLVVVFVVLVGGTLFYFIPTIIGFNTKHGAGVFVVNLCFGWTFLGWVLALVWAADALQNKE